MFFGYFTASGTELSSGARRRAGKRKHELIFTPEFSQHVTALKLQPGMSAQLLEQIVDTKRDVGIVLETYGSAAVPTDLVPKLAQHVENGFPIFLTSSCASGISQGMEGHDEDARAVLRAGIRNVGDMTTTAATAKLMNIKGNNPDADLAELSHEMIGKNYAGEITLESDINEDY